MLKPITLLAAAALPVGLLIAATAAEEIKVDALPKPVLDAVKAKYPDAEIEKAEKETEDGETVYEVELEVKEDEEVTVALKPDGTIIEVEKAIAVSKLPEAVTKSIKAKYPKAELEEAEEVTRGDQTLYEVEVEIEEDETVEILLDAKGKILEEEEEHEGDDEDDDDGEDEDDDDGEDEDDDN